jgi:diadenosine tetraphosphate (Ap4A) HIT family hydrolase
MPETPEDFYRRGLGAAGPDGRLPVPDMVAWDVFPFEPEGLRVKLLEEPVAPEPLREGEGGRACTTCAGLADLADLVDLVEGADPQRLASVVWSNERWVVRALEPSGSPLVLMVLSRAHHDLTDLSDDLAAELGVLLVHVARAVESLPHIARAHVSRWGDGGAHLHVFVFARPLGFTQLRGTMMAVWDDILPPVPAEIVRADAEQVAQALAESQGGAVSV